MVDKSNYNRLTLSQFEAPICNI